MHRHISMVALVLGTILGTLAMLVSQRVGAATTPARGNVSATDPSDIDAAEYERAPVIVDGQVLFQVRGFPAYPAQERAKTISKRIEVIAADQSVTAGSLAVVEMEDRTRVMAGDSLVVGFVDADAVAENVSRKLIAERALIKIGAAMASYRNDRSPRILLFNTLYALGASVLLAIVLLVIRGAFRRLDALAERRFKSRIEALEAQSHQLVQARQLRNALHGILKALYLLAVLVLGYLYLHFVLGLYPWTRPLATRLLGIFLEPLQAMGMGLLDNLPGLAFVAILVIVMRYVLRVTRLYFESIDRGTVTLARFDREWALPTYKIARLLVIAFAVVVAYPYIPGSSSEAFKGVSIFLGVVFSLGSSSVIANLIAGYAMIYRRAFKEGDRISIDNLTGDVTERRLMVTHLRTIKNEDIVVPNSTILNSHIINYSTLARTRGLILHTTIGIGYETPWRQVEAMLRLAADRTPGLLKEPGPFVLQKSLGDFAVTYELNAYCNDPQAMARLYTAMHQNILDVFNEHGVQIMTPAYEGDPEAPKVVPKDQWYSPPAKPTDAPANDGHKL
ncbi:MAG TPA: mechanosensitive ion channel family protein [Candidatus Binatia bacterium]|nr:mechanosensitive ion channel family protein [Candidatus Binatia bacterium]